MAPAATNTVATAPIHPPRGGSLGRASVRSAAAHGNHAIPRNAARGSVDHPGFSRNGCAAPTIAINGSASGTNKLSGHAPRHPSMPATGASVSTATDMIARPSTNWPHSTKTIN
jgi:hypothetical protein